MEYLIAGLLGFLTGALLVEGARSLAERHQFRARSLGEFRRFQASLPYEQPPTAGPTWARPIASRESAPQPKPDPAAKPDAPGTRLVTFHGGPVDGHQRPIATGVRFVQFPHINGSSFIYDIVEPGDRAVFVRHESAPPCSCAGCVAARNAMAANQGP